MTHFIFLRLFAGAFAVSVATGFLSAAVEAKPFAMPEYYIVPNDGKSAWYHDRFGTPEAAANQSFEREAAGFPYCQPVHQLAYLDNSWALAYPYYGGQWSIYEMKNYHDSLHDTCSGFQGPSKYQRDVRRVVVCDARLNIWGEPLSSGYAKENFPNSKCPDDGAPQPEKCPFCPVEGNPLNIAYGIKVESVTDFVAPYAGGVEFKRYYTSYAYPNEHIVAHRALGAQWRHGYERGIRVAAEFNGDAYVLRGDSSVAYFSLKPTGYVSEADNADRLTKLTDAGNVFVGWQYYDARSENVETYDTAGRLIQIVSRAGVVQVLSYNATSGFLEQVVDSFGRSMGFGYDADGRLISMMDPANGEYGFTYAPNGALQSVKDPLNHTRTYLYENAAYPRALTGVIDENGWRMATYSYDSYGKAVETKHHAAAGVVVNKFSLNFWDFNGGGTVIVTDPLGTARQHDHAGILGLQKPSNTTQPGTPPESSTYDTHANRISHVDFNGNKSCYAYDLSRNLETSRIEGLSSAAVCSTVLAAGTPALPARRIDTSWHAAYRLPATITEPTASGNKVSTFTYDANGNLLTKAVSVAGTTRTWSWTYDNFGRVLTPVDPLTHTTTNLYYANDSSQGNKRAMLNTVTNAAGHVTTVNDYNAFGQPLSITDPNGRVTFITYDGRQRMTSRMVGIETTSYDYDHAGQLKQVTQPDGSYLHYTYDGAHRLVEIKDGQNNRLIYTLDSAGNRIKEDYADPANALARTHSRVYDALNRLKQDIGGANPASQVTQYAYDANGNLASTTDPLLRVTTQSYDALNRLMKAVDPFNGSAAPTKYEYDVADNLTKVTDPKNLSTTYAYNGFGELLTQVSPDTGTTTFTYDAAGNMTSKTDARAVTATYAYDALNRPTTISYPAYAGEPAEVVSYTYDSCANGIGRLCGFADKTGGTAYGYDVQGRVTSKTQATLGLNQIIGYSYNAVGQQSAMTLPSGKVVTYSYTAGHLTGMSYDGQPIVANAEYDPFGPLGEWTWGNNTPANPNTHVRYTDLDGRLNRIDSGAGVDPMAVGYDAASRIVALQRLVNNVVDPTRSMTYGYDQLDRLTSAVPGAGNTAPAQSYTYDGVGNRLTNVVAGSLTNYLYGAGSHRLNGLSGAITKSYAYDAAGNRTSDGNQLWSYGGNSRPTTIAISAPANTFKHGINALGQRITKTANGVTKWFVYDESGHLIGEYDRTGDAIAETAWLNDTLPVVIK